ncbi:MAG: tRNA preQ1(34) S-adenosylmethionine ribosyltransferase-isomerase QueA [Candidatus Sericytochromatia bacterium]|nr:tRNA preQ1(34) S-adenosylmethionine ribosyltransferase-isomerase QueA [Candidatus Sericytochromatia bacterium]
MSSPDERLEAYDFELPEDAIAQQPTARREDSRLLHLGRDGEGHGTFGDLVELLREGDLLVLNDTRVMQARIHARRPTGGHVEVLLCDPQPDGTWTAMVRPGRKARVGDLLHVGAHSLVVEGVRQDGLRLVRPSTEAVTIMAEAGELPLPPYITGRSAEAARYQTTYARHDGSIAAPTAGLHFTPELLASLGDRGISHATLTLHVGLGTFLPVKSDFLDGHQMHAERFVVPAETAEAITATRAAGGRVIAVGTTTTRTLEAVAARYERIVPCSGETDLFIRPGHVFRAIDGLITNFHLPRSTLLVLVSTFAEHLGLGGRPRVLAAYAEAVRRGYRFYSFGDAMLLLAQSVRASTSAR